MGFLIGAIAMTAHALMANTFIIVRIMEPFWLLAAIVVAAPSLETEESQISYRQQEPTVGGRP